MDVKQKITDAIDIAYDFILSQDSFDRIEFLGIGKKIGDTRKRKYDERLIESFVSKYDDSERNLARVILQNQLQYWYINGDQPYNSPILRKEITMKIANKVVQSIISTHDIVGVQPLTGPVGLVYSLRFSEKSDINDRPEQQLTLEVFSQTVEAGTRQLQACWNVEACQDLKMMHNINFEDELVDIIGTEIGTEIVNEIVYDLVNLASKHETRKVPLYETSSQPSFISDKIATLLVNINIQANDIARTTRRGAGNFIVTSPTGLSLLQSLNTGLQFVPTKQGFKFLDPLAHVGYLTSNKDDPTKAMYKVFCTLANPLTDNSNIVKFLVGFKGGRSEVDTGYIYSPYIPVIPRGPIIDEKTYQPKITISTRYGKATRYSQVFGDSPDYYRLVEVDTTPLNEK